MACTMDRIFGRRCRLYFYSLVAVFDQCGHALIVLHFFFYFRVYDSMVYLVIRDPRPKTEWMRHKYGTSRQWLINNKNSLAIYKFNVCNVNLLSYFYFVLCIHYLFTLHFEVRFRGNTLRPIVSTLRHIVESYLFSVLLF